MESRNMLLELAKTVGRITNKGLIDPVVLNQEICQPLQQHKL
jgi:hypothetical protein